MDNFESTLRKAEFQARIFVSFGIVILVCLLCYLVFPGIPPIVISLGRVFGLSPATSFTSGSVMAALILSGASVLRMWAGTLLQSHRVMAFRVQTDALMTRGAYLLVRNPIYLADLTAISSFTLFLPPVGLLLPLLFTLHYLQLIKFEELSFAAHRREQILEYEAMVPRFLPDYRSVKNFSVALKGFHIDRDGIRHNSLFLLFVPGFIAAAFSHEFLHAVLIGLPAVIDWAIVHTRIGIRGGENEVMLSSADRPPRNPPAKKVFSDILYSQCWEDPAIDRAAFNITPNDVLFSITSGGCNVLTYLLDDPKKIIALDLNPSQNYLLELKIAAFKHLTYDELLEFVGVRNSRRRRELYGCVRLGLRPQTQAYWDHQLLKIEQGIIHCGKYERYISLLRKCVTRFMGQSLIDKFFTTRDTEERARLFHEKWENIWWWLFTRVLLSRTAMVFLFDKAFFEYLDGSFSFGKHFARKAERALTQLPTKENYFLSYILLGKFYDEGHLPPYLGRENYEIIRDRVDRIEIVCDSCEHYFTTLPDGSISKFNFTNIFEWMSPEAYEHLLKETIRVACDGAIMTYRNLLVFRERPVSLQLFIHPHRAVARSLHESDLSFIYNNYVVEEIHKKGIQCHIKSEQYAAAS